MPLTQLDPGAALIVIDMQKGIVASPTAHCAGEIVDRAAQLTAAFRDRGLTVALVNVTGGAPGRTDAANPKGAFAADWANLIPELRAAPTDLRVTKQRWGAFLGTSLDEQLRKAGVTQVFLAGISTSIGVESTARSAYDLGYNVVLVIDAMTDRVADNHRHSVEKVFPRLGEIITTAALLERLRRPAPAESGSPL